MSHLTPNAARGKVLLVDRPGARRAAVANHVTGFGYEVALADSPEQGLKYLEQAPADLLLVRALEAETDEAELKLLARMQSNPRLDDMPIIVLAPDSSRARLATLFDHGAEDYLLDPISPTLLRTQLDYYAALARQRHQQREHDERNGLLKIERDVEIAKQIQQTFLPKALPQVPGWELAARFEPARRVAGDFYDAFLMTQGRRIGVVIADVCDKGVGSALFMALVRSLIRAFAQQNFTTSVMDGLGEDALAPRGAAAGGRRQRLPSIGTTALINAVTLTNNYVTDNHLETNYFATLFFGVADPDTGAVAYINGGHNPPYVLSPEGVIKEQLKPTGPAVGMFPGATFTINTTQLAPGDTLFMFTDGVTDARNPTGASVTTKGLVELISRPPGSATTLVDTVGDYLRNFIATADQFDDITMLALHRQA